MSNDNSKEGNSKHGIFKKGTDLWKGNTEILIWLHVIIDAGIIIFAFILAYYLRYNVFPVKAGDYYYPIENYMEKLIHLIPFYLFCYYVFRLYTMKLGNRKWIEVTNIILANIVGMALFILILYILKANDVSRILLFLFMMINIILTICARRLISYALSATRRNKINGHA